MAEPQIRERRNIQRLKFSGLLPGKLIDPKTGNDVIAKPVDVSEHGLGLIISEQYTPGHVLKLETNEMTIELRVMWARPDFGKRDLFRYGLMSLEKKCDLVEIFRKAGCIR